MCHYCSLGREVGKALAAASVRGCPTSAPPARPGTPWRGARSRPGASSPHRKDCETLRPQRLCLSALRSRTVRSGRAPVRVRLYRSHHQHRRTPGPGDQPPLDHHRRQPARAGSARAGRGRAAACWRPARPSNTPAAARCPPRWARCAAPIIASARTASRSRCRFRIRPGDAAYLALTPRGDCFLAHEAHSLSVRAIGAACRVHHHLRNPLNRALAQAYRPRGRRPLRVPSLSALADTPPRARWPASSSPLPGPRCPAGATTTCRSSGRCSSAIAAG